MDLEYGPKYEAFRSEVRAFLEQHKPERPAEILLGDDAEARVRWLSLQIEHGYWARTIPTEYGGFGAAPDLLETVIMDEEFNRAGVPRGLNAQGPSMLVPTLLEHGTEEQKRKWISPTMRGEIMWCQGYSEPGAGSDLASLQTAARDDGDDFVVNGQKIWTSSADKAQMIFVLVRTEPDAPKHAGISYLLAPMDTPGIEVQPLRTMSGDLGENSFNQVFFSDVRVPRSNIVGARGEGWMIANTTLKHERNSLNANCEGTLLRLMHLMRRETSNGVCGDGESGVSRSLDAAAGAGSRHEVPRHASCSPAASSRRIRASPDWWSSCRTASSTSTSLSLAIDVMGELGVLYDHTKYERDRGYWQVHSIFSLGLIIGGGTAQIQRTSFPNADSVCRASRSRRRSEEATMDFGLRGSEPARRQHSWLPCGPRAGRTHSQAARGALSERPRHLRDLAELGATGILVPEAQGGSGLKATRRGVGGSVARVRGDADAFSVVGDRCRDGVGGASGRARRRMAVWYRQRPSSIRHRSHRAFLGA